jgi:hypothetical protein
MGTEYEKRIEPRNDSDKGSKYFSWATVLITMLIFGKNMHN